MISHADMVGSARHYLRAARILNRKDSASPDIATYLCGYAVEIALKARIVVHQGMAGFPATDAEFRAAGFAYKTHDFDRLLVFSGQEPVIKARISLIDDWNTVHLWNPNQRYAPIGTRTAADARDMIEATRRLQAVLL